MKTQIVLVGAGAFGRETLCWLRDADPAVDVLGYLDDSGNATDGLPCLGTIADYRPQEHHRLMVTIADPKARSLVVDKLRDRGVKFASLIHPKAVIAPSSKIGEGCILCPYSVVSVDATLEAFVIVNVHSSVGHDVHIGNCSSACVLPGVSIGDDANIGAGSVVVRSVPAGSTVYAQPAKRLV
jgi:UDP-3-O-[3-hydroxymyristoyl] glucosamine N-acyltransferase